MPHQPNLFSTEPRNPTEERAGIAQSDSAPNARRHTWLARTELLVRVIVRLYVGLLIIALPWLRFWAENGLLHATSGVAYLAGSGVLRGMVSGLGVLNVAIAIQELFARKPQR